MTTNDDDSMTQKRRAPARPKQETVVQKGDALSKGPARTTSPLTTLGKPTNSDPRGGCGSLGRRWAHGRDKVAGVYCGKCSRGTSTHPGLFHRLGCQSGSIRRRNPTCCRPAPPAACEQTPSSDGLMGFGD